MAWSAPVSDTAIAEGAKGQWVTLLTKEIAHVHVTRTDIGTTDTAVIRIYGSVDGGVSIPDIPIQQFLMDPNDNDVDFTVTGLFSYAIGVAKIGSTDTVTIDVKHVRDGGLTA